MTSGWTIAALLLMAAQTPQPTPVTPVPVANIVNGEGAYEREAQQVIRDEASWRALWTKLHANMTPEPARPAVDFSKEMLVVAAMGSRGHGGYRVTIDAASMKDGVLTVNVTETSPGANCMNVMMMTAPVTIARLPASSGEVKFDVVRKTVPCR